MRFVILGAGAVGGTIGWRLHDAGHDVAVVARGRHLQAIRRQGLRLRLWDREAVRRVTVAGSADEVGLREGDVLILATKVQDAGAALESLAGIAPPSLSVVCAQNGVAGERMALRRFAAVYGMCVRMPATFIEPGVIEAYGEPCTGILDLGRYPEGTDATAVSISEALAVAGFSSLAVSDIMRHKYWKLVRNLHNAVEAACGVEARRSDLATRAREEALTVLAAAGIEVATDGEQRRRGEGVMRAVPPPERERTGGSTWQSLRRGTGSIETDYLNGEIVLLGRLNGVPTPVNATLQHVARELAREGAPPGGMPLDRLRAMVDAATG